jgi:hypothetical protein
MKRGFAKQVASFFALFCVVFIPFPFNISKVQLSITEFIFGDLIGFVSSTIFGKTLTDTHVHSDTIAMYLLVSLLFVIALMVSLLLSQIKKWALYRNKVFVLILPVTLLLLSAAVTEIWVG